MRSLLIIALALVVSGATGCMPARVDVAWARTARVPPPAPFIEQVPPAPGVGFAWVNGYWWWEGNRYVWVRGYWAPRPRAGYAWMPSGWTRHGGEYRFIAGRWVRQGLRPGVQYVHPVHRPRVERGRQQYRVVQPTRSVERPTTVRPGRR